MKKTLIGIVATAALAVASSAQAAAFLNIDVSGTSVSCNTATLVCSAGFFNSSPIGPVTLNSNGVIFSGSVNGVSFDGVLAAGGEGTGAARAGISTFNAFNTSGSSRTVTVSFAVNGFTLPTGSPIPFSTTQSLDNLSGAAVSSAFTGWANAANTLLVGPGNGTPSVTPTCSDAVSPPTTSCATNGPTTLFARSGPFALNGIQSFTMANNQSVSAQASIVTQAVPEPASMLLLGTGLVGLAGAVRRRKRNR